MKENIIKRKSYDFALLVVKIYKKLTADNREFVLSKQLLRSGTSIGANIEEAVGAQSRNDFLSKISIAYKESRETKYWIMLLFDTGYLDKSDKDILSENCDELCRLLGAIQKTMKGNL